MKCLFLTSGPRVPSTRFRILQYLPRLRQAGHTCIVAHAWPAKYEHSRWLGYRLSQRARRARRWADHLRARMQGVDVVVLERELFDDDSSELELAFRDIAPRFVLDVDDGVFLRWPDKFRAVARVADQIIAGSRFLADECRQSNPNVVVIPTCVDVSGYMVKRHATTARPVVGWTGTSSNIGFLAQVAGALEEIAATQPIELAIIADEAARPRLPQITGVPTRFIPWSPESERAGLLQFDVGIMPLPDDDWSRFKCGFKLVQYMASGLPAVASPVGVNREILGPGLAGFISETQDEWVASLSKLLGDLALRQTMGSAGRHRAESAYSVETCWPAWRDAILGMP